MTACRVCEQPLRSGEETICQPCFDRRISTLESHAGKVALKPRRADLKAVATRAAAKDYLSQHGPPSTGFHMDQLYNNKNSRLKDRKEASSRRMLGTPASQKLPPFASGSGPTLSLRRACSVGWMVQYEREHHSLTVLRGVVHVNRTSSTVLLDTKMAIFDLWPRETPDPTHWSAFAPTPPSDYHDKWFVLARSGSAKKPPTLLHNDEVLESHLAGKGEPNLELIFLADQYYKDNPSIPRPGASFRTTLASGSGPSKIKRKHDETSSNTSILDSDVFVKKSIIIPNLTSAPCPSSKKLQSRPSPAITNAGTLKQAPFIIASTSQTQVPLTLALPHNQTLPSFNFQAPIDVTAFAQNFAVAVPEPVTDAEGFTSGKRLHLQLGKDGKPEWIPVSCFFKVDESKVLGRGSFRTCYTAYIRDGSGKVKSMVAKKFNSLPTGKTELDAHKESGGTYAAVASVMAKFKLAAVGNKDIMASPKSLKAIRDMRIVDHFPVYSGRSANPTSVWFFEEALESKKYRKYTSNHNFRRRGKKVDVTTDVMQAFTHYSYQLYGGQRIVADLQGVGSVLSDPLIVDMSRLPWSDGNIGSVGLDAFVKDHVCASPCVAMGLDKPAASTSQGGEPSVNPRVSHIPALHFQKS